MNGLRRDVVTPQIECAGAIAREPNAFVDPHGIAIGAGVIAVGESIDWSGLEPWFVLGPLVIHVPLGVVAWRVIRKRYTPEAA